MVLDGGNRSVARYEIGDGVGDKVWVYEDKTTNDTLRGMTVHPDGQLAALLVLDVPFGGDPGHAVEFVGDGDDGKASRVILLDVTSGQLVAELELGPCLIPTLGSFYFSSDGSLLGVAVRAPVCDPGPDWSGYVILDTSSWTEVARFDFADVTMTENMSRILVDRYDGNPAELRTYPEMELLDTFDIDLGEGGLRLLSSDGATIIYRTGNSIDIRPGFWDVKTNQHIAFGDGFNGFFSPSFELAFTPAGHLLATGTESDGIYDVTTGQRLLELPNSFSLSAAISPGGLLAATANQTEVLLWDIGDQEQGRTIEGFEWVNSDTIDDAGPRTTFLAFDGDTRATNPHTGQEQTFFYSSVAELDPETGETLESRQVHSYTQLPDGRLALVPVTLGDPNNPFDDLYGPLMVWDPSTNTESILQDCQVSTLEFVQPAGFIAVPRGFECEDGFAFAGISVKATPDGRFLAALSVHQEVVDPANDRRFVIQIWDLQTNQRVRTLRGEATQPLVNEYYVLHHFDGSWIALHEGAAGSGQPAQITILDAITGEPLAKLQEEVLYRESSEVSADGSRIYLFGESGEIFE